ncbi:MAG TPA: RNA pseudouridine synthase, partial [Stellaceae bacterium]|nr:RNA pseudouridine synthase [Stellaceae bacterium]
MTSDPKPAEEMAASERRLSATVEAAEAGERLDRMLARRFDDLSRTRLKHLVEEGRVSVDGA